MTEHSRIAIIVLFIMVSGDALRSREHNLELSYFCHTQRQVPSMPSGADYNPVYVETYAECMLVFLNPSSSSSFYYYTLVDDALQAFGPKVLFWYAVLPPGTSTKYPIRMSSGQKGGDLYSNPNPQAPDCPQLVSQYLVQGLTKESVQAALLHRQKTGVWGNTKGVRVTKLIFTHKVDGAELATSVLTFEKSGLKVGGAGAASRSQISDTTEVMLNKRKFTES
jgi:hypothetical protein